MLTLQGKHNTATVFTYNIEQEATSQIIELLSQEFIKDSKIRLMPDVHAGKGCCIGTTMTIQDKVVPNLVGVDISCGMETMVLGETKADIDLKQLDEFIHKQIPAGFNIRDTLHPFTKEIDLTKLKCNKHVNLDRAYKSIGTLGGGNHFIELGENNNGNLVLVIHSGSRHLGGQIAKYYQDLAFNTMRATKSDKSEIIKRLKAEGRESEIESTLKNPMYSTPKINKQLAYLEGQNLADYIHDMEIAAAYASLNRKAMVDVIVKGLNLTEEYSFTTNHNYIEKRQDGTLMLRKGAVRAEENELLLIPINMRDGSLLCRGKGNPDWNYSAPHGAGRLMSRSKAKDAISLEDFQETMKGVYSTTVGQSTLDEAPDAYKPIQEIIDNINDTVEIIDHIKPIYNFKG